MIWGIFPAPLIGYACHTSQHGDYDENDKIEEGLYVSFLDDNNHLHTLFCSRGSSEHRYNLLWGAKIPLSTGPQIHAIRS